MKHLVWLVGTACLFVLCVEAVRGWMERNATIVEPSGLRRVIVEYTTLSGVHEVKLEEWSNDHRTGGQTMVVSFIGKETGRKFEHRWESFPSGRVNTAFSVRDGERRRSANCNPFAKPKEKSYCR